MLCPHCQAAVADAEPGAVCWCAGCGNQFFVPEAGGKPTMPPPPKPAEFSLKGYGPLIAGLAVLVVICLVVAAAGAEMALAGSFGLALIAVGVVAIFIYFLPTIAAVSDGHPDTTAICVLNILLGWTFLGWVIALVWACKSHR